MTPETIDRMMQRLGRKRKFIKGCEATGDADSTFLARYTLMQIGKSAFYLHVFLRSDGGEDLHDHPWGFCSLILQGGYIEVTERGRRRVRPGMLLLRPATWAHRVELLPECPDGHEGCLMCDGQGSRRERPSVSLVWRTGYCREWGFFTSGGWKHWKEVFLQKGCSDDAQRRQGKEIHQDG